MLRDNRGIFSLFRPSSKSLITPCNSTLNIIASSLLSFIRFISACHGCLTDILSHAQRVPNLSTASFRTHFRHKSVDACNWSSLFQMKLLTQSALIIHSPQSTLSNKDILKWCVRAGSQHFLRVQPRLRHEHLC